MISEPTPYLEGMASVVVLTYNRPKHLRECCRSLLDTADIPIELIITDGGSSAEHQNKTLAVGREYKATVLLPAQHISAARALNNGVECTRGEYLFYVNDDIVMRTPGWTTRMLDHVRRIPNVGLLGVVSNSSYWRQVVPDDHDTEAHIGESFSSDLVAGIFCCQPREPWRVLGGYDECFFGHGGNDADFSVRCHAAGYAVHVARDVYATHRERGNATQYARALQSIRAKYGVDEITHKNFAHCVAVARD